MISTPKRALDSVCRYRAAWSHKMPHLYGSFSAKEPYDQWLFCEKWPATSRHSMGLRHPVHTGTELDIQAQSSTGTEHVGIYIELFWQYKLLKEQVYIALWTRHRALYMALLTIHKALLRCKLLRCKLLWLYMYISLSVYMSLSLSFDYTESTVHKALITVPTLLTVYRLYIKLL